MTPSPADDEAIFHAARGIPDPDRRRAFVREVCAGDETLIAHVEALLAVASVPDSLLDHPLIGPADDDTRTEPPACDRDEPLDFLNPSDQPGSLGRLGHYEVQQVVGRGGMGVVLKAFDESLHRVVAIKVMAPQLAASATARKRFVREARAAAAVIHDHVVTIHAVEESGPLPHIVMQFVAGASLQDRLDRSGPLPLAEVLRIGMQAAAGLAAAHAQGLVHRDVKPANILLENGVERVKLTDFGLARAADDASLTQSGTVAGTPQYMSPEQAEGKPIDHRADLFSLGSVLYALCTGRPPFRASTSMGVLKRVCEGTPTPIRETNPDVPDWLAALIEKLHAKDPADRYQSAAGVADVLGRHLAHVQHPSQVVDPAAPVPASAPVPRPRRHFWAVAAAVLVATLAGLGTTEATGVTNVRATVVRIFTPEGTLVVETEDSAVKVTVEGDGDLVITGAGPQEVRLKAGSYRVKATRDGKPVKLDRDLVTISRGDTQTVKVRLEGPVPAAIAPRAESGAFVLLDGNGIEVRKWDALADAVQAAATGDTIEVRGNGPFLTPPLDLGNRALTIRAGEGYRPVIKLSPEWAERNVHLLHTQAALVLEGLELHRVRSGGDEKAWCHVIENWAAVPVRAANCRFVLKPKVHAVSAVDATVLDLRNCEFLLGTGGKNWNENTDAVVWRAPAGGRCRIQNCLMTGKYCLGLTSESYPPKPASVVLAGNTLAGAEAPIVVVLDPTLGPPEGGAAGGFSIEASANVLDGGNVILNSYCLKPRNPPPTEADFLHRSLTWKGDRNQFSPGFAFTAWAYPAGTGGNPPGKSEYGLKNLTEWNRFWRQDDSGCRSGKVRYRGGDLASRADLDPERLTPEDFRLRPDSAGYQAGKDGKDLGADIDLVGPGAAYERWKKTPEYQDWLRETGQVKNVKAPGLTPEELRERQAAEVFLRKGGSVSLMSGDAKTKAVLEKPGQSWPAGTWHVHEVFANRLPALTPDDLAALRDFPRLRGLNFTGSPVTTASVLDQIEGGGVAELRLTEVPTTSKDVARIAGMKTLSALYLYGTGLSDEDIARIANLPLLSDVNVGGNQITDESMKHLARLPLGRLYVSHTKVTDVGLTRLHSCKSLLFLRVSHTGVTAEGVASLHRALPNCEVDWVKDAGKGK
jgi:hypothetical protein